MITDDKTSHTDTEDLYDDAARWATAEEWHPKPAREYARERDRFRREHERRFAPSAFRPRTANATLREVKARDLTPRPLFLDLWHTGELALLIGPHAAGKSTLATQIAECLSRGGPVRTASDSERVPDSQLSTINSQLGPRRVVLLDLNNTDAQFARRYTVRTGSGSDWVPTRSTVRTGSGSDWVPTRSKNQSPRSKIRRYTFSQNFKRPKIDLTSIPDAYAKDPAAYMRHSLECIIDEQHPQAVIIDALDDFAVSTTANHLTRTLRWLKHLAHSTGIAILVAHTIHECANAASKTFRIPRSALRIASAADTAILLNHSTYRSDFRYLKRLSSDPVRTGNGSDWDPGSGNEVHIFQLRRSKTCAFTTEPTEYTESTKKVRSGSPPYKGGVAAASADGVVLSSANSALPTANSQPPTFLGFEFLGMSPEHYHLDLPDERQVSATLRRDQIRQLAQQGLPASIIEALVGADDTKKRKAKNLIEGLMNGEYLKYMNK